MPATNRRRRWPFCLAAIAILAMKTVCFPPVSSAERQMLGRWHQEGKCDEFIFEAGH